MTRTLRGYSVAYGFFVQDNPLTVPSRVPALPPRFGLIDDSPDCWTKFKARVSHLNGTAPAGMTYKLLWMGRHGQGWHNVGEAKYGTKAWDDYWSKLNGDGEIVWGPDPLLTELGESQAREAHEAWLKELPNGIPVPEKCYASPLHRALSTWNLTFSEPGVLAEPQVLILENLREEYGEHTCDMRNPKSVIQSNFPPPVYSFESGFLEEDTLWTPDERETKLHVRERAHSVLDKIFSGDETYVSITAHGGIINGILAAMGHPPYSLPTGGVLPLVVRAISVM